jgi:hypothetical protein
MPVSIHDSATHHISNVSLLQENVNNMLWSTETQYMSFVPILSTVLELSRVRNSNPDNDTLQTPHMKNFVLPTRI